MVHEHTSMYDMYVHSANLCSAPQLLRRLAYGLQSLPDIFLWFHPARREEMGRCTWQPPCSDAVTDTNKYIAHFSMKRHAKIAKPRHGQEIVVASYRFALKKWCCTVQQCNHVVVCPWMLGPACDLHLKAGVRQFSVGPSKNGTGRNYCGGLGFLWVYSTR